MTSENDVRAQVVGHLTSAYHAAAEIEDSDSDRFRPGRMYLEAEPPNWTVAGLIIAYAAQTVLIVDYARKAEQQPGLGFLEYLREEALGFAAEDLPATP